MNNPNPFIPQGSLLEQHKRRSRMKLAVFCVVAMSVASLTAMLIEGCKREETENPPVDTNQVASVDTNTPSLEASNPPVVVPPISTNTPAPIVTPPPVVNTPQPEATQAGTYVVVKGDTLGKIAKANGVSLKALEAANPDVQPTRLKIGEKLNIPAGASGGSATDETSGTTDMSGADIYVVKSGDTLSRIAHSHGTTVKALEAENNLSTSKIKVGQRLKIPASAESNAASAAAAPAPASMPATPPTAAPAAPAPTGNGQ